MTGVVQIHACKPSPVSIIPLMAITETLPRKVHNGSIMGWPQRYSTVK